MPSNRYQKDVPPEIAAKIPNVEELGTLKLIKVLTKKEFADIMGIKFKEYKKKRFQSGISQDTRFRRATCIFSVYDRRLSQKSATQMTGSGSLKGVNAVHV